MMEKSALAWNQQERDIDLDELQVWNDDENWMEQTQEYEGTNLTNRQSANADYEDDSYNLQEQEGNDQAEDHHHGSAWPAGNSNDGFSAQAASGDRSQQKTPTPGQNLVHGFVSLGRMHDRHVPSRDFPHPQPNDPILALSPVYGQAYPADFDFSLGNTSHSPQPIARSPVSTRDPYNPSYGPQSHDHGYQEPENDLVIPQHAIQPGDSYPQSMNQMRMAPRARAAAAIDPSQYDDFELPRRPPTQKEDESGSNSDTSSSSQTSNNNYDQLLTGSSKAQHDGGECEDGKNGGMIDYYSTTTKTWCGEHRDHHGPSGGGGGGGGGGGESNAAIEFGVVGYMVETFWPKPGDIMILANERTGCQWPAFDGHLEIYVDDEYFSKISVALQWNYNFNDGDIVLRFGDFDRHWKWRASDHIHVFLRDNGAFCLVSRQAAQELHPLDFRFVDPHQRKVHTVQYHFRPRIGDFVLRKGTDDSYLWQTNWWHPGGDSHLLLKHLKEPSYPQGPDPKYRWSFHWYRREFQFEPEDILLRVGYESAEDNMHSYCVCEIYFHGKDRLWTFQGRDDYSFGPPSHAQDPVS